MGNLLSIFIGSLSLFLVIRLIVMPMTLNRIQGPLGRRPGRLAAHAAIGTAANLMFWFALSAGLVLGAVSFIESWRPINLAQAETMLGQVRAWSDWLSSAVNSVLLLTSGAAALALLWYSHRRTRKVSEADLTERMSAVLTDLEHKAAQDALPPEDPTENMQIVGAEIAQKQAELETLQASDADPNQQANLSAQIEQLVQLYWQMDLYDRAERQVQSELANEGIPGHDRNWIATFFTSNGFHNTLSGVGKMLAVLCILAIIPASLVVTGPLSLDRLDTKYTALEKDHRALSFEVAEGEINQAWAAVVPEDEEPDAALTETDLQIAAELGHLFESQHVPDSILRLPTNSGSRSAIRIFQRDRVRSSILSRAAQRSPVLSATAPQRGRASAVARSTNALMTGLAEAGTTPQTAIGKRVQTEALDLAKRNPSVWGDVKRRVTAYRKSFGVAASPARLQAVIVNHAIGDVVGNIAGPNGFWGEQARRFGSQISASSAEAYTKASARAFMTDIATTGDINAAMNRATTRTVTALPAENMAALRRVAELPPSPDDLARQLRANRTTLTARTVKLSDAAAARVVRQSAPVFRGGMDAAGALVEFADFFPGHQGQELETKRAKAARAAKLRGAPPSLSAATTAELRRSRTAVARAGSYGRLRGFSRIGGVLIGRAAEISEPVLVDYFDWRLQGRNFSFDLALNGGSRRSFGPVDAAIAHLALVYAADGRPTTVTMVTAPPLSELRILTHPALIDTGLGCRARRLDQFADEVTNIVPGLDELRQSERTQAVGEVALYNLARDLRIIGISQTEIGQRRIAEFDAGSFVEAAERGLTDRRTLSNANLRLLAPERPLTIAQKPAYFDRQLVDKIEQCRSVGDVEVFAECIITASRENASRILNRQSEWLAPRIEYQTWSGVRERGFTIDETLSFLGDDKASALGPLRFMVQLAISSPAFFADSGKPWYDEENTAPDEHVDRDPWEFERTGPELDQAIAGLLSGSEEHADIYSDMVAFTYLQRLFRMALDGPLSESFPIQELPKIADATAGTLNTNAPTLRWNARAGEIEARIEAMLRDAPGQDSRVQACLSLVTTSDSAKIPTDAWNAVCSPTVLGDSLDERLSAEAQYLSEARALRFELDVANDDLIAKGYALTGCPRP